MNMEEYQPQNSPEQGNGSGNNDDFSQRKAVCAIAYLFGILFFLPLILYPNDAFGKFHANQSLVLLIVSVCGSVVFGILALIPIAGIILMAAFSLLMFVLCIVGLVGAARGEMKELPVIGKFKLIK